MRGVKKLRSLAKPLTALVLALVSVWIILRLAGYDAALALEALFNSSFKSAKAFGTMLNRSSPLLFTGLAVAIAYRSNILNIGAEGQLLAGAIAATWVGITFKTLPGVLLLFCMFLAGVLAGAIFASIPGLLKVKMGISEVITTIMFNYIAKYVLEALVRGPFRNLEQAEAVSWPIAEQAWLPIIYPGTKLHIGYFIGAILAVLLFILLFRTFFGFELRAVGYNSTAARTNGINVTRTMMLSMLLSGGLAGLGGAIEIAHIHYLSGGISPGYGFTAIAVSLLAANNPIGIVFTCLIFGFLSAGSTAIQRVAGISSTFVQVFQGLIVIFVAFAAERSGLTRRRFHKKGCKSPSSSQEGA